VSGLSHILGATVTVKVKRECVLCELRAEAVETGLLCLDTKFYLCNIHVETEDRVEHRSNNTNHYSYKRKLQCCCFDNETPLIRRPSSNAIMLFYL
jgi:hypothetical protein